MFFLYGREGITDVNKLRYATFCAKKGELDSHQLPSSRHWLFKHILRANYQTLVWKSLFGSLSSHPATNWAWLETGRRE